MFLIGNLGISCIHSTDRAGSRGREQWTTLLLSRVIIDFKPASTKIGRPSSKPNL